MEECAERIRTEGMSPTAYKLARAALIKAIGEKGAGEYNRREYELLEKLIMICRANPYWLFDEEAEADHAEYDMSGIAGMGDAPCVFTTPDIV